MSRSVAVSAPIPLTFAAATPGHGRGLHTLPASLARAVADGGVDLYPAVDDARQARRDALIARLEARRQRLRNAQGLVARRGAR